MRNMEYISPSAKICILKGKGRICEGTGIFGDEGEAGNNLNEGSNYEL